MTDRNMLNVFKNINCFIEILMIACRSADALPCTRSSSEVKVIKDITPNDHINVRGVFGMFPQYSQF